MRRLILKSVVGLVVVAACAVGARAQFVGHWEGGAGGQMSKLARLGVTPISSAADLDLVRADLDGHFMLVKDIDLTGVAFTPIGNEATPFRGVFDGNGRTIHGAAYDGLVGLESGVGFFGWTDGATVKDLRLTGVYFTGFAKVGGLGGAIAGRSTVIGCAVSGEVRGLIDELGGLVGIGWDSAFIGSSADVFVNDALGTCFRVGGFVGHGHLGSSYETCEAHGDVRGRDCVGGFSGVLHGATAIDCFATGRVEGLAWVGGFTGYMKKELPWDTYAVGCSAPGDKAVVCTGFSSRLWNPQGTGGLAGLVERDLVVQDCWAERPVFGYVPPEGSPQQSSVGGLIGYLELGALAIDCWASGDVEGNGAGGAIGWAEGCLINVHATGDVSGTGFCGGLVGSVEELALQRRMSGLVEGCSATGSVYAGPKENGHATPGENFAAAGGLVGYMFPGSVVLDSFATGDVEGEGEFTGGLIGILWDNTVRRSFATGTVVSHGQKAGGLVGGIREENGANGGHTEVSDCYAWGDVIGVGSDFDANGNFGGLIGGLEGDFNGRGFVLRCYSIGHVPEAGLALGGLVGGGPNGSPRNVIVDGCVWDTWTSGTKDSAKGEGLETPEMQDAGTYTSRGWDFETVWMMDPVSGYPILRWEGEE